MNLDPNRTLNHMSRLFSFVGGSSGSWQVTRIAGVIGVPLAPVSHLEIRDGEDRTLENYNGWVLRGITSNERYVTRGEKTELVSKQPGLGRPKAINGALIPIKKTVEWWSLSQEERRRIFEEQSNHVKTGMMFLPAIAHRLYHCRDLGPDEPFDFLTWFEFAPEDANAFEDLVGQLRRSPEWNFVDRECDIRVTRDEPTGRP